MIQDPDQKLVKRAQKGDQAAFGRLVDQYYQMVYAVAYGVLNQREEAQDAAQEIFIKVQRVLVQFKGDSKFKTWLYRISVNGAIDLARKRKPTSELDEARGVKSHRPDPMERASQAEEAVLVRQALEDLSPDHRAVLVLREWNDLSYEEIAETLEIEVGTVMSRIFYARKKLGEVLKPRLSEKKQ